MLQLYLACIRKGLDDMLIELLSLIVLLLIFKMLLDVYMLVIFSSKLEIYNSLGVRELEGVASPSPEPEPLGSVVAHVPIPSIDTQEHIMEFL